VLIEAEDGIRLSATDLELAVIATAPAEVSRKGRTTLPARLMLDVVSTLGDGNVEVEADDTDHVTFRQGRIEMSINGLPADEFPSPPIATSQRHTGKSATFLRIFKHCFPAVSTDDTRQRLTGINLVSDGETLRGHATDSHRLSRYIVEESMPEFNIIVPAVSLRTMCGMLEEDLEFWWTDSNLCFSSGGVTTMCRLIEGEFANVERAIPKDPPITVTGPTAVLREAVRRCLIIGRDDNQKITFDLKCGLLPSLSAHSSRIGSAEETVDLNIEGLTEDLTIAFNAKYLLDGINLVESDEVTLYLVDGQHPAMIQSDGLTYVVMPMQLG
jgi:DNA polymerase-3 subunit beta